LRDFGVLERVLNQPVEPARGDDDLPPVFLSLGWPSPGNLLTDPTEVCLGSRGIP